MITASEWGVSEWALEDSPRETTEERIQAFKDVIERCGGTVIGVFDSEES